MIILENLHLDLGVFKLININLIIESREYAVIMGPSGAGKTLLLHTITGMYKPDKGRIIIDGVDVTNYPPENRNLALIPQDYALFPHMTVFDNIAYGLKARGYPYNEIKVKVENISEILNIKHLLNRKPKILSSGEKQRVAIARALVIEPKALLLDEPTASLDPELRARARNLLKNLHEKLNFTAIHVTHDIIEAIMLAEKAAFMINGKILRIGRIDEVLRSPEVSKYCEDLNIIKVKVYNGTMNFLEYKLPSNLPNGNYLAVFRPEDIVINDNGMLKGLIREIEVRGPLRLLNIDVNGVLIKVYVTRGEAELLNIKRGKEVSLTLIPSKIKYYSV